MPRTKIEYGGCSHRNRSRPRRSATHCASTICSAGKVELPITRTLPWCTRSDSAPSVSSMSVRRVGPVGLVEVDVVGVEPAQAVLDLPHDPAAGRPAVVRVLAHRRHELGGQHDLVAPALERLADDLLRLAAGVHVGGVDEVDAAVERGVDDLDAVVVVAVAPGAEHHRPEAVAADLDPGGTERGAFHASDPTQIRRGRRRGATVARWRGRYGPAGAAGARSPRRRPAGSDARRGRGPSGSARRQSPRRRARAAPAGR